MKIKITPGNAQKIHAREILAATLGDATRVQVWNGVMNEENRLGTLVAAFVWLEEAVQLIRAMDRPDADNLVITQGTHVLWDTGCSLCSGAYDRPVRHGKPAFLPADGSLHSFDNNEAALDAIRKNIRLDLPYPQHVNQDANQEAQKS